jgi:hypothetical protein
MIDKKKSETISSKNQVMNAFDVAEEGLNSVQNLIYSAKSQYGIYLREFERERALHSIIITGNYSFI